MIRFAVKVGIATGAVYYVNQQGVWRDSQESEKTYENLKSFVKPYLKEVKSVIPFEIPELPKAPSTNIASITGEYWNKLVLYTFAFVSHLPDHCNDWTQKGLDAALSNPEVKSFVDSFSSTESVTSKK